jgi:hypothetical protein
MEAVHTRWLSAPQLQFIISSGPPAKAQDDERSRAVRSHAMRYSLQNRSAISTEKTPQDKLQGQHYSVANKPTTGKFKLDSWSRKSKKKPPIQYQRITGTTERSEVGQLLVRDLGPLTPSVIPPRPLTAKLLNHCESFFLMSGAAILLASPLSLLSSFTAHVRAYNISPGHQIITALRRTPLL